MLYHEGMSWHQGLFENRGGASEDGHIRSAHRELLTLSTLLAAHAEAEERAPDALALAEGMKAYLETLER